MDPATGLPDRRELIATVDEMLTEVERPALFAVAVSGYGPLAEANPAEAEEAMREAARRLGRFVRANDLLAVLAPGVFALAGPGVEHTDVDVLLERVRGVFALPVELGDHVVSFPVTIGIAHPVAGVRAEDMVAEAEADLRRRQGEN